MNVIENAIEWLKEQRQYTKMCITAAADYIALNIVVVVSYMLRVSDFALPPTDKFPVYFIAPLLTVVASLLVGVYQAAARGYSSAIEKKIVTALTLSVMAWVIILFSSGLTGFARSVVIIYLIFATLIMIAIRRFAAMIFNDKTSYIPRRAQIPLLIYGAGRHGQVIAQTLLSQGRYRPVAFIDNDPTMAGRMVSGLRVHPIEDAVDLVNRHGPQEAIVAQPGLNRGSRRQIVEQLVASGLLVKIAPDLDDIINNNVTVGEIRPIRVEDLLGRDSVPPDQSLMHIAIANQVVMVTGAGGSIGSELVRQACSAAPRKLVLVENNEFALFEIRREMERKLEGGTGPEIVAILADVQDESRMTGIMALHHVDIVFHAAAYKHVRLVQENAAAGIRNNCFGTEALARAAVENKVKRFVLISTDKAVRPTSIMGASKRLAEMIVQAIADEVHHETIFSIVRFGNVLGSTGSVVPIFRQQINSGGPVLVTHPEVTRYFMLIPEAAQLVIQASALGTGGEVYVLDMGEPIKIVSLAQTMIEIAGLKQRTTDNPEGDIEIKFSGLVEGEKLYEELQIGRDVSNTAHPRIMKCREFMLDKGELDNKFLLPLREATDDDMMKELVMFAAALA